jgi:aminoglycoside phosphotransferase (APT) family kinase protein
MDQMKAVETSEEASVLRIVAEALGIEPIGLERVTLGHISRTYKVHLPDHSVIVRTNAKAETFTNTAGNIDILRSLGLPVPTVLASDLSMERQPFAYMVMACIPGRDLLCELAAMSRAQMTTLAEQIVRFQRTVGTLPRGDGFGYVGIGQKGPQANWWDVLFHDQAENPPDTRPLRHWHSRIYDIIRRREPYLRAVIPMCFLDDITVKNVMIEDGMLAGLVDFDCVCYGDPLWWIGLTASGVVSDVGSDELFYVDEICRLYGLSEEQRRIVPLYAALHASTFINRSNGSEGEEWTNRLRHHIDQWLDEAAG